MTAVQPEGIVVAMKSIAVWTKACALSALLMVGCSDGNHIAADSQRASAGQVTELATRRVTYYAASRFAEQASFGATPELVSELQAKGFEAWIEEQMALSVLPIDVGLADGIYDVLANVQIPLDLTFTLDREVARRSIGARDQLRWRVAFSTSNFIVAAFKTKGEVPGWIEWTNLLQRQAFANYADTLREVTLNSYMAHFLDNDQNRPRSSACPQCAPNENYARELMQLFSLGVVRLASDGRPVAMQTAGPWPPTRKRTSKNSPAC